MYCELRIFLLFIRFLKETRSAQQSSKCKWRWDTWIIQIFSYKLIPESSLQKKSHGSFCFGAGFVRCLVPPIVLAAMNETNTAVTASTPARSS
jgi:hypothetical protein